MQAWFFIIYFFSESLFFGTLSIFGGVHTTANFTYFNVILAVMVIVLLFYRLINKAKTRNYNLSVSKTQVLLLISVLSISMLISYARFYPNDYMSKILSYFMILTIPAGLLGLSFSVNRIESIYNKFKYINLYLTLCFALALYKGRNADIGILNDVAGASHLLVGYTMSALFAFNLLQFINNKKLLSKIFYLCLMALNILLIVFSGSRGSLVSIMLIFLIASFKYLFNRKRIFMFVIIAFLVSGLLKVISTNQNFEFATARILSALNTSQDQSSQERYGLYDIAIQAFKDSPIIGNGVGSFSHEVGKYYYPHNIVLELLNDFGLIGIIVAIILFAIIFKQCKSLLKADIKYHFLVFLFINCFVQLIFSGSYLVSSQFWVISTLIWVMRKKKDTNKSTVKSTIQAVS